MSAPRTVTYRGENRHGVAISGRSTQSPAEIADQLYFAGVRWLVIERAGVGQVGGISAHPDTGVRSWWGEQ